MHKSLSALVLALIPGIALAAAEPGSISIGALLTQTAGEWSGELQSGP